MKLGLVSAILDWMSFEEMIDTISSLGYECVEAACWPSGKAERRYAGVSHIDVDELSEAKAEYILNYCKEKMWRYLLWRFIRIQWTEIWRKGRPILNT